MAVTWRFIDSGNCSAAFNMAMDEAIATSVRSADSAPTLRFYGWDVPSVSIGYFQKIHDIDLQSCKKNHIPVVRRLTGGRAVLHGNEITYSFSSKTSGKLSGGLLDSYRKLSEAFSLALSKIGIATDTDLDRKRRRSPDSVHRERSPECFQSTSYGELTSSSKKIIGSAQKRWADGLLQQGSLPFMLNSDVMREIFMQKPEANVEKSHIGLNEILPDLGIDMVKDVIKVSFEEIFGIRFVPSPPSEEEFSLARVLEAEKYSSRAWTFRR